MGNFTAGTSFTDGVTNDVTAVKLRDLVENAVPTSSLALASTSGTISNFTSSTATLLGAITGSTNVINIGSGQIYKDATGAVGIGTTSPSSYGKLTVDDTAAQSVYIRSSTSNYSGLLLENTNSATKWQIGVEGGFFNTAGKLNIGISAVGPAIMIDSNRNVGIGTASPAAKLHVDGTIRYTNRPAAGTITALGFDSNGDLKASSSSLRYKHDVQDYEKGLSDLMQLRPVSFKFNGETRKNAGFIAEEVNQLGLDEVMLYDGENRPDGIIYTNMISLLTKSIQELKLENDSLKSRIEALEAK